MAGTRGNRGRDRLEPVGVRVDRPQHEAPFFSAHDGRRDLVGAVPSELELQRAGRALLLSRIGLQALDGAG